MDTHVPHEAVPPGIDPDTPSTGRLYDYYLGGTHHLPVDREAAEKVLAKVPEARYMAAANRGFLQRATGELARAGIRQFIDIGSGIPTAWNTHQVAQIVHPDANVVYVDNDPLVLAESRELLRRLGETNAAYADGDIRDPASILESPQTRELIDFTQPVAYIHAAIWHFVGDDEDPRGLLRQYLDAVVPGSYLALSHVTADQQRPEKVQAFRDVYKNATAQVHMRTREEIDQFFQGLEYLQPHDGAEPGLSFVDLWGSKNPTEIDPAHTWLPCGVARK